MKLETFFEHFDLLAEAPNGVQKLRELILDLAVRGKLVPQDANDEPAAVLLERMKKEKERLVKEGKIKKSPKIESVFFDNIPFKIPNNWQWIRLVELGITQTGTTPPTNNPQYWGNFIPFIKPGNMTNFTISYEGENLSQEGITVGRFIPAGSVLMVCIGGSIGKTNITDRNVACNQQINAISPLNGVNGECLLYFMKSIFFYNQVLDKAGHGTLQIISKSKWEQLAFPLPPLNEQKRIVTKVDELMKLCDELEARQKKKRETRILINNAALNKLLTADTPETFTKNWQCIGDNFDILYSAPENIGKLRQAILQLAVMGKLVPQDANDEPAAVLLERIKKEKERLISRWIGVFIIPNLLSRFTFSKE